MYKLLLLDIDGTLRDERLGIPESAKKAIKLAQQHRCKVALCTGRSLGTISDDVLSLNIENCIAGGGSYIKAEDRLLYDSAFEDSFIQRVVRLLKGENAAFAIESQCRVFMNEKAGRILNKMNEQKAGRIKSIQKQFIQEKIIYEDNINEFEHDPIHKICLWSSEEVYMKICSILKDSMEIAQAGNGYYEIIQKGCHKGDAVRKLQRHLQISKEETICFGDGQNDIEMFAASGTGIAMEDSHPSLKNTAASVCESAWEHGIFNELTRRNVI